MKRHHKRGLKNSPKVKRQHIPKDYPWKVLSQIIRDIENLPLSDALQAEINRLRGIVRGRNVSEYIDFCKDLSLTTVCRDNFNAQYSGSEICSIISEIRIKRLLTLFQKYDFHNSPFDQKGTALRKFIEAENACKRTNRDSIWEDYKNFDRPGSAIDEVFTFKVLREARDFISSVLGEFDVKSILNGSKHGPGATAEKSGNDSIPLRKFSAPIGVTPGGHDFFLYYLYQEDRWLRSLVQHFNVVAETTGHLPVASQSWHDQFIDRFVTTKVEGSRILFVPKNAETFRTICAEPTGNVFIQLGIDRHIRKRLLRYGIDLSTQKKNQDLALFGSVRNTLSTLDLSSASDTIALATLSLFPRSWADALKALRCPVGFLDGKTIVFEKLSSMGNGFTFAVETLIFTALLYAVVKCRNRSWEDEIRYIAVYGDDIICPTRYTSDLIYMLRRCGFSVNSEKSFFNGPVRESCGEDFFCGYRISRPTIKALPMKDWELYRDHNRLYIFSYEYGICLKNTFQLIQKWCSKKFFGPPNEDVVGWLFDAEPHPELLSYSHRCAVEWQHPLYVLSKYVVTHPKGKKKPSDEFYEPMAFLNGRNSPLWYESSTFSLPPPSFPGRGTAKIRNDHLTFNKIEGRVKVTVQLLPFEHWGTQDH